MKFFDAEIARQTGGLVVVIVLLVAVVSLLLPL